MTLESEILELWAGLFPVEGYKAGLSQCQGRLFHNTEASLYQAKADIARLQSRLDEVADPHLRTTAIKLLLCFQAQLEINFPADQVHDCADGVYVVLLKGDQGAPFVAKYLAEVEGALREETARWCNYDASLETRKLCLDSADYLRETLTILKGENPDLSAACNEIMDSLAAFEKLFVIPELQGDDFETFYTLLQRQNRAPQPTPEYPRLLSDLYDYPETAEEMHQKALDWLEAEMPRVKELANKIGLAYGLSEGATIEQVYAVMDEHNPVGVDALAEATSLIEVVNRYTAVHILGFGPEDRIVLERTPTYLEPLGTEGSLLSLNYLTASPKRICYITPSKNKSRLTMINVLVHEYGHGFHESMTGRLASSPLLKIPTPLMTPLTEAIAFHREWEFWEDADALLKRAELAPEERDYLTLFGAEKEIQRQTVQAFELETRFWRIARFLRILGDVEVHLGLRTHVDFVEWAHAQTGLSKKFIHDATFSFLKSPGYAPCYAIAGMKLGELQRDALPRGMSRREFNTWASSMGYWPRTIYEQMLTTK